MRNKKYKIVYIDTPWYYYGSKIKDAACGKHYETLKIKEVCALPMRSIMDDMSVVFLWATGPRMDHAIDAIRAWGLHYAGIQYIWIKTRKSDGQRIIGQGPLPKFNKNYAEYILAGTTNKRGRPFPIQLYNQDPIIYAPTQKHSRKPDEARKRIVELCGNLSRIELFATEKVKGWDSTGYEVDGVDIREFLND